MNIMLVIVALLVNLLSGGTESNVPTTIVPDGTAWSNPNYLVQLMYMYGGNVDMNRSYEQEYDKTYVFEDGFKDYGWGKGSSVRVHGNMNTGIYFDFDIKVDQHQQEVTVDTPVEGLKVVTSQYSNGEAGYSFSVGPINLYTAIQQVKEICLPQSCNYKISQSQLALRDLYIFTLSFSHKKTLHLSCQLCMHSYCLPYSLSLLICLLYLSSSLNMHPQYFCMYNPKS